MAITRQKKEEVIAKVRAIADKAKTLVFVGFKGLTVAESELMRKGLKSQGIGYTVAKKSLIRRALEGTKVEGEVPELPGEIAIAHGDDELAPPRELAVFAKKFDGHLAFVGGIFGGRFVDKAQISEIAAIPSLQTLRAQFVQLINSPLQKLVIALSEVAKKRAV